MPTDPLDRDFPRFLRTRDPQALAAVFDAAAPRLLLVAMHLCRDAATAEDLVQTVFLQALRDAARFDPRQPVLPWLLAILEHRAADQRDRAHRRRERGGDAHLDVLAARPAATPSPPRAAIAAEVRQRLAEALAGMPGDYRDVLTLRLVHGLGAVEIAHAHGVPPATVRTRLRRGLELLRGALPRGLATPGLLALLGGELARAQDGLAAVRAKVLAAAGVGAGAAVGLGAWLAFAAALLLVVGGWWWIDARSAASELATGGGAALAAVEVVVAPAAPPRSPSDRSAPVVREAGAAASLVDDVRRSTITGRAIDAVSRTPLAGVTATLRGYHDGMRGEPAWDWQDPPPVVTGADGVFAFALVPPPAMTFQIELAAPAHVTAWPGFGVLREGVRADAGDVVMQPGTPVQVRLSVGGRPLAGVEVAASHAPDGARPNGMVWYERSGPDGVVHLGVCEPGAWFFEARTMHRGNEGCFDVPLQPSLLDVPIELQLPPRERSLSGVVVDRAGAPVPGVELAIGANRGGFYAADTRADGAFLFAVGGVDTPVPLSATRLSLWGKQSELELLDDGGDVAWGRHDLRLVVRRRTPATLRLEVIDASTGAPVERFAATTWLDPWAPGAQGGPQLRRGRPEQHAGGVVVLDALAAGARFVSVFPPAPWAEWAEHPLVLAEGEQRTLRVELQRPAELVATALDAATGAPLAGIELALAKVVPAARRQLAAVGEFRIEVERARRGLGYSSAQNTLVLARAVTGADGSARLVAPPDLPGLVLFAEGPRCIATVRHDVELPRGGTTTTIAVVPAGEVRGVLGPAALRERCGPTPRALADLAERARTELPGPDELAEDRPRVELRPAGSARTRFHAHVDAEGAFAIGGLPPGLYEAWVQLAANDAPGAGWTQTFGPLATIDVRAGANPPLALDAPELVPARATVRFFVGGQAWHGPAGLRQIAPTVGTQVAVQTDATGEGRTEWLAPGAWVPFAEVVDAEGERRAIAGAEPIVVLPGRDVDAVAVLHRRRVVLDVVDAAGAPAANRWLHVEPADHPGVAYPARRRTDAAGRIVLDPAPPGALRVRAWLPGRGPGGDDEPSVELALVPATATTATLALPR